MRLMGRMFTAVCTLGLLAIVFLPVDRCVLPPSSKATLPLKVVSAGGSDLCPKTAMLRFSDGGFKWARAEGSYLVIGGYVANQSKSEVFQDLIWSSHLKILLNDGRQLDHATSLRVTPSSAQDVLHGAEIWMKPPTRFLLDRPLGPGQETTFKVDGMFQGRRLRVSEAELLYQIQKVFLTLSIDAITPLGECFSVDVFDSPIAHPETNVFLPLTFLRPIPAP